MCKPIGFLVIFAAAAMPVASAAADEVGSRLQLPSFEQVDANHDGVLSRSELPDGLQDMRMHFSQYAYADNRITRQTYAWYASSGERRLTSAPRTFLEPHGRMAPPQSYLRADSSGATPTPPVHKR